MVGFRSSTADLPLVDATLLAPQPRALFYGPFDLNYYTWAPMLPVTEVGTVAGEFGFGPELSAARSLTTRDPVIGVVKVAINATNLYNDWNAWRTDGYYNTLIAVAKAAMAALPVPSYVAGFFWMQGESDADGTLANAQAYQSNLTNFITHARTDLDAPAMPFILGQISRIYRYSYIVRAAQWNVAASVPGVKVVPTDDLHRDPSDVYHFSTAATVQLGERMVAYLKVPPA